MLLHLRSRAAPAAKAPPSLRIGMKAFAALAARPRLYRAAAALGRRLGRMGARDGWIRRAPGLASGWTAVRDLKAPAAATFQTLWRDRTKGGR
jgi:L-lactate dehydrogenase complex protein LldF